MSDFIKFNVTIILYNVLNSAQINELRNDFSKALGTDSYIQVCSTPNETTSYINRYRGEGDRILLGCRQADYERLTNSIPAGHIDMTYLLNNGEPMVSNNDVQTTVFSETGLQFHLMDCVYNYIVAIQSNNQQSNDSGETSICDMCLRLFLQQMEDFNHRHKDDL